jgi:putative membrane protein
MKDLRFLLSARTSTRTGRRARICAGLAAAAMLVACDAREQKPKVGQSISFTPFGAAHAQQADQVVPPAAISGAMAPMDEAFALFAASSNLAMLDGARLVLKSTKRSEVRDYAQALVRDHTRGLEDLRRIVAPRGLKLPPEPTGRHADLVTKLSGVAAPDRDDAFLQRFGLDGHKETISLFERHAAEGQDPALQRYAQQMMGPLREHMAAAQKLMHAAGIAK